MFSKSIKSIIIFRLSLVAFCAMFLTGLIIFERTHFMLYRTFDNSLLTRTKGLVTLTEVEPNGLIDIDFADEIMSEYSGENPEGYFIVLLEESGSEIERSKSLENLDLYIPDRAKNLEQGDYFLWNVEINNSNVRFAALSDIIRLETEDEENTDTDITTQELHPVNGLFIAGLKCSQLDRHLVFVASLTFFALLTGFIILITVGWHAISSSLLPLIKLKKDVENLSSSNLLPVTVPDADELAIVANTLNNFIKELSIALERERKFTANVAHELRTPICELRSLAEIALKYRSNTNNESVEAFKDVLESSIYMEKIVNSLLLLARYDSGVITQETDEIDISELISIIWTNHSSLAENKNLNINIQTFPELIVLSDKRMLTIMIENLILNAVTHSPEKGNLAITSNLQSERMLFSISNTCENLTEKDVPFLFDRFWQKDNARSTSVEGYGIGLSLVKTIAEHLDLNINVQIEENRLFTITVSQKF